MPVYPYSHPSTTVQPVRAKRRQVKNACTHCQKACKKCDDARPCLRCVKYGHTDACVDSKRKERKKGLKRGPYKKRDGKARASCTIAKSDRSQAAVVVQTPVQPQVVASLSPSYVPIPITYPHGFFPFQHPVPKSPQAVPIYSQTPYYIAPGPQIQPAPQQLHQIHQPQPQHILHPAQYQQQQQQPSPPQPLVQQQQQYYQPGLFSPVNVNFPQYPVHRQDPSIPGPGVNQYSSYSQSAYSKNLATINPQSRVTNNTRNGGSYLDN